ncbi:MAG: UvrD-helicase domain-containing protein [Dehalococcoidia bacterium]
MTSRTDDPVRRIAEATVSPLRVVAGPGTGKTFAMMKRVEWLLGTGVEPKRIFVCSFTRTAAGDLGRALQDLGVPGADEVRATTVHSYCFSVLAREHVLELTGRTPRTLMQFEERFVLEDLSGVGGGVREGRKRLKAFNASWARLQSDDPGWPSDPTDKTYHQALLDWLRFHRGMLVGELVPEALRYLRSNPTSPEKKAFDYFLVDEYQDLNRSEQVLLDVLAENGKLTVIGDEDQSIYSFKHAHPEGIVEFDQSHPGGQSESLLTCRRCPSLVVTLANHLISSNSNRPSRQLTVHPGNGPGEVRVVQWETMFAEADGLARFVSKRIGDGTVAAGQVLVLAPRRQFGYEIRDALLRLGHPAVSFFQEEELDGDPKDLNASQAQQQFTALGLLVSPDDAVSLRCWCGFGSSSLNAAGWAKVRAYSESSGKSLRQVLTELEQNALQLPYTGKIIERFRVLNALAAAAGGLTGQTLVDALFPDGEDWAEPFRSAALGVVEPDFGPAVLYQHLRSIITQPELPTEVEYIRVMSLHKSKGLTAQMVLVAGCLEGIIPSSNDDDASRAEELRTLEEQRRLFYVAITRTRETLVLSSVARLPVPEGYKMRPKVAGVGPRLGIKTIASRFLDELGPGSPAAADGPTFLKSTGVTP